MTWDIVISSIINNDLKYDMNHVVIAHNIRSMHNVGAIFRACYCFEVEKLFLTGYTAAPPRDEISKVALSTDEFVDWEQEEDAMALIERLKGEGYVIAGLELDERAYDITTYKRKKPVALLLGSEVEGISPELRDACDVLLEIPIHAGRTSLNISVATGIALHELRNHVL